ncbi:MAG: hypothetical protein HY689_08865 [Chloroflexi bacterium]|nr:hypothetical protein [Chloroflexota bacterium]
MGDTLALAVRLGAFFLVTLALLVYTGYGPTALLVPAPLRRYGWLLAPGVGYCWFAIAASFLNSTLLPMTWATALILALATAANLWAWRRLPAGGRGFPFALREQGVVAALALVPYLLGVLPLLHAGSTAFVGVQWDLEVYLPITEYLKRYAISVRLEAPPNPLVASLNAADFRGGSGWGFSYLEAGVGVLLGWPSYLTFRPLLVAVLCLSVPGWYVLARAALGAGRPAALLAAALWSIQGLSLWVASMGLAGHTASYGLLPLALALTAVALDTGERRAIVLAGSAVAGLVLTFYTGALPFYVLPTAAWLALRLRRGPATGSGQRPERWRAVLSLTGVGAAALALAPVAHLRFLQTLVVYGERGLTQGWNVAVFSPVAEALGLSPFVLVQETARAADLLGPDGLRAYLLLGWLLALAAGAVALVGLVRGPLDRLRWAGLVLPTLGFALFLRWGLDYPYGYFKALSLAAPLLIVILAVGVVALWERLSALPPPFRTGDAPWTGQARSLSVSKGTGGVAPSSSSGQASTSSGNAASPLPGICPQCASGFFIGKGARLGVRLAVLLVGVVFLGATALNTALSVRYFWEPQRDALPGAVWELAALRQVLPPGAPVYVLGRSGFDPRTGGMVAYFLMDYPLVGSLETAYRRMAPPSAGQRFEYLLLLEGVAPEERGLRPEEALWRNDLAALYRVPERWAGALEFEGLPAAVEVSAGLDLALQEDGWRVARGDGLALSGGYRSPAEVVQPELTILTFGASVLEVAGERGRERLALAPGIQVRRLSATRVPGSLRLRTLDGPPPVLLGARLLRLDAGPLGPEPAPPQGFVALRPDLQAQAGGQITAEVGYGSPDPRQGTVTLAVEVYGQDPRGGLRPYSAWEVAQLQEERFGTARFTLDLERWTCKGGREDAQPSPLGLAGLPPDGTYHLHLVAYHLGDQVLRWPWLTLRVVGGKVEVVRETPPPPVLVTYLPVPADVAEVRERLPDGAEVLLVPDPDPDRSFIVAAAGFLEGRRPVADPGFPRDGVDPAEPGRAYEYALLPAGLDPRAFGYDDAALWENEQARLYRRGPAGPLAAFRFPAGYDLGPEAALRLTRHADGVELAAPGSGAWTAAVTSGSPVDLEAVVVGVAAASLAVSGDASGASHTIALPPGVARVRLARLAPAGTVRIGLDGGGRAQVAALYLVPATGEPPGATALAEAVALRVRASPAVEAGAFAVWLEAFAGPDRSPQSPPVVGVDVYNRGQCALLHYGYWATPLPPTSSAIRLELDPAAKRGTLSGPDGQPLSFDAATWPTGDGRYRAVAFLRQGERMRWVPVASFTLRQGVLAEYRPLAGGRLLVLR